MLLLGWGAAMLSALRWMDFRADFHLLVPVSLMLAAVVSAAIVRSRTRPHPQIQYVTGDGNYERH
jgi:hypothetical protein